MWRGDSKMGFTRVGTVQPLWSVASANQLQRPLSKANQDKNPPRTIVAIFGADQKSEGLGMGRQGFISNAIDGECLELP